MLIRMIGNLGVGGPRPPLIDHGWDLWPVVGIVLTLWICRRLLDIPWRTPILIAALAGGLLLPVFVQLWGIWTSTVIVSALCVILRWVRSLGAAPRNPPV